MFYIEILCGVMYGSLSESGGFKEVLKNQDGVITMAIKPDRRVK